LLKLIARTYEKDIIIKKEEFTISDRSLLSTKFLATTGYTPPSWDRLVRKMRDNR